MKARSETKIIGGRVVYISWKERDGRYAYIEQANVTPVFIEFSYFIRPPSFPLTASVALWRIKWKKQEA